MKEKHDTLKMLEELAALKNLLIYGPDDGADADMLEVAHRADVLAAQIAKAQTAKGRRPLRGKTGMLKIDVWDCDIRGLGWWRPGEAPVYLDDSDALLASPAVHAAAVAAVEAQGGALNMSGWYDASDELMEAIEQVRAENVRIPKHGGPELATIQDYQELNPAGSFTQDDDHIYEDGKPAADAIFRARLYVRVDEDHPLDWDDLKLERTDE